MSTNRFIIPVLGFLALCLLVGCLYRDGLDNFFYNDDFSMLYTAKYRSVGEIVSSEYPADRFMFTWRPYWRPGWYLAFKAMVSVAGIEPMPYMLAGVGLHALVLLAVYLLLLRMKASPFISFSAVALFASCPTYLEAVFWPSASFNVLPAALFHLLSVWTLLGFVTKGGLKRYLACYSFFLLALTFKEPVYNLPLLTVAAYLLLNNQPVGWKKIRQAVLYAVPFLPVLFVHFFLLNRYASPPYPLYELIPRSLIHAAKYFQGIFHTDLAAVWVVGILSGFSFLLFTYSRAQTRFFLIWFLLSIFPFGIRAYASRFAYFCFVPLALMVGVYLSDVVVRWGRKAWMQAVFGLALLAVAASSVPLVGHEIAAYRSKGEVCRHIIEWCKEKRLTDLDEVWIDRSHPSMVNGFTGMTDLFLGKRILSYNLLALEQNPFLVYGNIYFLAEPSDTAVLRLRTENMGSLIQPPFDLLTRVEYERRRPYLPLFGFYYHYEVVEPAVALERIMGRDVDLATTLLVDREPSMAINRPVAGVPEIYESSKVGLEEAHLGIRCPARCLMLIAMPKEYNGKPARFFINGEQVPSLHANGMFSAIELPEGDHAVRITYL